MKFNYKNASLEFDETKDIPTKIIYSGDIFDVDELKEILSLTYGMYGFQLNPDKDFPFQIKSAIWTAFNVDLPFNPIIPELPEGAIP